MSIFILCLLFVLVPWFGIISFYLLLTLQAAFSIYWMLFAWEDGEEISNNENNGIESSPRYSFTALIAARHEEKVIADTIHAVDQIAYPQSLKETIIICRADDTETIKKVNQTISELGRENIKLVLLNDFPINKPHSLNIGLGYASGEIVVIFDAEDQPHPDIYRRVNDLYVKKPTDVVQAAVQLTNFRSSWFATLNVLEYFFWFKSTLHYFAKAGIIPLGGNTVFFRRHWLSAIGGWDEECLTEDADIGIRLSASGAIIRVIYDERIATCEETPPDWKSFIKQRTRWHQGFIQIFLKGDWLKLKSWRQRLLAAYILILPEVQGILFVIIPFSFVNSIVKKLPPGIALLTSIPMILLVLQLVIYCVGLYEFTKAYKFKFPFFMPFKVFLTFYPFQALLGISALRAVTRMIFGEKMWEKTRHINAHREAIETSQVQVYEQ